MNVHLGLVRARRGSGRSARSSTASAPTVPDGAPLIIAGDFNDWRSKGDRALTEALGCVEVFEHVNGRPARTFPSLMPVFRLDRIYARGLKVVDARVHYATLGQAHVRPRGARRDVRGDPRQASALIVNGGSYAMNRFTAGNSVSTAAQRRRILSRADRCDRRAPSARSGSESYIYADDETGRAVADALIARPRNEASACVCWSTAGVRGTT